MQGANSTLPLVGRDNGVLLEVSDISAEARDVLLIELRASDGGVLPAFEPGAHIELDLPNGLKRHYSLANDWRERDRYLVAVGRSADGRGGSSYVHKSLRVGTKVSASRPRNNFALDSSAGRYLFIAGGIGITPLLAMCRWCEAHGRPWRLVYAARSAQRAAFYEVLRTFGERVCFHFDDGQGGVLNVAHILAGGIADDEHVYCCGPNALMDAVRAQQSLPSSRLHFEYFNAPAVVDQEAPSGAFRVELRKSGLTLSVPPDKSILEVLEEAGLNPMYACRAGVCRTCEVAVCSGAIDHRDFVLSEEERESGRSMMICVSRAASPLLTVDL